MFKTQIKPRVVSLQSFEHFDVIAMVDKSTVRPLNSAREITQLL